MKINRKFISTFIAVITCLFFSKTLLAWDATGHIVVAQIAYNNLTPIAKKDVNFLINKTRFASNFSQFTPYVYSASWPDYLKYNVKPPKGKKSDLFNFLRDETKSWHYYDAPFVVGNFTSNPPFVNNSIWAVHFLISNLSMLLLKEKYNEAVYALIFITHIVGDIHQPLHNINLYDVDFPHGDLGGNLYMIQETYGVKNLHALWDKSLGYFYQWGDNSMNAAYHPQQKNIEKIAHKIQNLCDTPRDLNPADWEKSSHQIAVRYVYPFYNTSAPKRNQKVSSIYIAQGRQIAAKQMCLAGKRLAAILNKIFIKPISIEGVTS